MMRAAFYDRLQGWAMVATLAAAALLGTLTLARPHPHLAAALTPAALLDGRAAAAVNDAMAHDLPIGPALSAAGSVWRWAVFGSGGPQVTPGCGQLFLTEELRPWPGAEAAMAARAAALHRIHAQLEAHGTTLAILLVPDKARVAACPRLPYAAQARARYDAFARQLAGLPWVDLLAAYASVRTPLYYRTDTHWNQDGAALAAAALAATTTAPISHEHPFATRYGPTADRPGDLLRLMGLATVPNLLRPHPDREAPAVTTAATPAAGLLDDDPTEVALIGSSYSLNGNFHGALQEALAAPVAQYAQAGGGFWRSARDYFRSPEYHRSPPTLVVWEIPERVVGQPIDPEEAAFLASWESQ